MRYGALEAGGTKMVCAVCDGKGGISDRFTTPTADPKETLRILYDYFADKQIDCLGIACFGPIDLHPDSPTYGHITSTPKLRWQNVDIVGNFRALGVPIGFDTDVNGSVLGETTFGIGRGVKNCVYLTIGTGFGAGVLSEGRLLHGMLHPEGGHVLLPTSPKDPMERGICPFHPNCAEGLTSGPALKARWGVNAKELGDRDEVWDLEAFYLAEALIDYTMVLSPEMFILGGGVMHQREKLLPKIRAHYRELMNGYIKTKQTADLDHYIVAESLNDNQGLLGAGEIGRLAYEAAQR